MTKACSLHISRIRRCLTGEASHTAHRHTEWPKNEPHIPNNQQAHTLYRISTKQYDVISH